MAGKGKLFVKIGEACKELDIQPYVLRYWETEFPPLSPDKSKSGQRVYSEEDLAIIRRIKELLYEEGFTIAGAKKKLESELAAGGPKTRPPGAAPAPKAAPAKRAEPKGPPAAEQATLAVATAPPVVEAKPAKAQAKPVKAETKLAKTETKPAKARRTSGAGPKAVAGKATAGDEAAPLRKALEDALEETRALLSLLGD